MSDAAANMPTGQWTTTIVDCAKDVCLYVVEMTDCIGVHVLQGSVCTFVTGFLPLPPLLSIIHVHIDRICGVVSLFALSS